MKTYQDYYEAWVLSTESRDLAFDEWLMLLLARKEEQMIDKACKWLDINYGHFDGSTEDLVADFRKAMEK